ncbi:hypothetical protein DPQ33_07895 [Oceanidesulfovibrio indonesiensis]|uniref:Uncharacterized protein n=1 Tax=Oceanidesulfovibrio indonesiensis TaxID=54767 RepID=A0A7M3MFN6_9BACT|nr:hypothetical protein DPQ33_07895 [Oceanidesulfovibrio indonesiensis]
MSAAFRGRDCTLSTESCIGCGWCCLSDPCWDSHRRYGQRRRCPDLYWDDKRHRYMCGLMDDPEVGPAVRHAQDEGGGCCAPLNPWRQDVRNRDED